MLMKATQDKQRQEMISSAGCRVKVQLIRYWIKLGAGNTDQDGQSKGQAYFPTFLSFCFSSENTLPSR